MRSVIKDILDDLESCIDGVQHCRPFEGAHEPKDIKEAIRQGYVRRARLKSGPHYKITPYGEAQRGGNK